MSGFALARHCAGTGRMALLAAALILFGFASPADAAERTVALTFDDLPMVYPAGEAQPLAVAADVNRRILDVLKRHRAPATGFVNEGHIQALGPGAERILDGWNQGDFELANHGKSHADANALDLPMIEREIIEGDVTIRPLALSAGRRLRFFRFPFNHLGETAEKQAGAMALLKKHGYQLAPSTIDTSDYVFEKAYTRALRLQDKAMQDKIKEAFLDHTETQIAYYAGLNRQVLGYEPPAIMLLHTFRLNAETLDAQIALFRKAGYRFVSLAEAQADPAYTEPPRLPTRFGPMWGYRWARDRGIKVDGRLEKEPADWVIINGAGEAIAPH